MANIIDIFKALSCETRFNIVVGLIEKSECNVGEIVEILAAPKYDTPIANVSQPNVSQHLVVLKNAEIIQGYRRGNQMCYKVTNETVVQIIKLIQKSKRYPR